MKRLIPFVILTCIMHPRIQAQDGLPDSSFNMTGFQVTSPQSGKSESLYSLKIFPDGKIIAAGISSKWPESMIGLIKYRSNGLIDSTFGNKGIVTKNNGSGSINVKEIALQADDKIVTVGGIYGFNTARFYSYGISDYPFGGNGIINTSIPFQSSAEAIAIQSDNKIVVGGSAASGANSDFALLRYESNGALDKTFGGTGIIQSDMGSDGDYVMSLAIQTDGKILAAGYTTDRFALIRYLTNGAIDTNFANKGKFTLSLGRSYAYAQSVKIQKDGKILIAGLAADSNKRSFAIVRLKINGTLDSSFAQFGINKFDFNGTNDEATDMAIQKDNKILIAGTSDNRIAIARLLTNGAFDPTWGTNGKMTTKYKDTGISTVNAICIQDDDKVLVGGIYRLNGKNSFALARFHAHADKTSLTQIELETEMEMYPNPCDREFHLNWKSESVPAIVKIHDIHGKLVSETTWQNDQSLTISTGFMTAGIYSVSVQIDNSNTITKKLVIIR